MDSISILTPLHEIQERELDCTCSDAGVQQHRARDKPHWLPVCGEAQLWKR